jgi:hypothetical protein
MLLRLRLILYFRLLLIHSRLGLYVFIRFVLALVIVLLRTFSFLGTFVLVNSRVGLFSLLRVL